MAVPVPAHDQSLLGKQDLFCSPRSALRFSCRHVHTAAPVPLRPSVFTPAHAPRVCWKTQAHRHSSAARTHTSFPSREVPWCSRGATPPLGGAGDSASGRPGVSLTSSNLGLEIEHRESHLPPASLCGEPLFSGPPLTLEEVWPVFLRAWKPDLERLTSPLEEVGPLKAILTPRPHFTSVCQQQALSPVSAAHQAAERWSLTHLCTAAVFPAALMAQGLPPAETGGSLHSFLHGPSSFCGPPGTRGRGPSPFFPRPGLARGMRKAGSGNAESWNSGNGGDLSAGCPNSCPTVLASCCHHCTLECMWAHAHTCLCVWGGQKCPPVCTPLHRGGAKPLLPSAGDQHASN